MPPQPTAKNRLLVEGKDDKWVVVNLMMRHGVDFDSNDPETPYVHACETINELLEVIRVSAENYQRLGVLVDADIDVQNRWSQIADRFQRVGIVLPREPQWQGAVLQGIGSNDRVGVWVMPDNRSPGRLEDFLSALVSENDPCWPYADEATRQAKTLGARFPAGDHLKARIHTWLAWQEEPGLPFGTAVTAKYFNSDTPEARAFVDWFNRLFF